MTNSIGLEVDDFYFRREFEIAYQPIFALAPRKLHAFESLLRRQQDRTQLYPANFMSTLQSAGLGFSTDCWVLKESCKQIKHWQDLKIVNDNVAVHINMFDDVIDSKQFANRVDEVISKTNVSRRNICLELSQKAIFNGNLKRLENLVYLQSLDIRVCIDDFVPTKDSLEFLIKNPVEAIKLDGELAVEENLSLAEQNTLDQIRSSGTKVIFKKIDSAAKLDQIDELGDYFFAQGFLLANPLAQREATGWVAQYMEQSSGQRVCLSDWIACMNKLTHIVNAYLGPSIVQRYWASSKPALAWLSAIEMDHRSDNPFTPLTDFELEQHQLMLLQKWLLSFLKRCSLIIRNLPYLLPQADFTPDELSWLGIFDAKEMANAS